MWGVGLLTWGLPWVIWPGVANPFLEPKLLLFTVVGWGTVCWALFKCPMEPSLGWKNPWTFWVLGWAVAVSCWKFQWLFLRRLPESSEVIYNVYTWVACLTLLLGVLLVYVLAQTYLIADDRLHQVTRWMCGCAALAAVYGLCQAIGWDQWYAMTKIGARKVPVFAGFGNQGYLAVYLAMVLPLCLVFSSRRYLLYAGLMLFTIWLTQTHYAWALVGIGLTASVLARWWTRLQSWARVVALWSVGSGVILLGLFAWEFLLNDVRWEIWTQALAYLPSTTETRGLSMTGWGLGSFGRLLGGPNEWAHNSWIHLLIELGVIGFGLTFAMVCWTCWRGWHLATRSVLLSGWFGVWMAFLATTLIHFPDRIPPLAFVGLCAWAVIERNQGVVD